MYVVEDIWEINRGGLEGAAVVMTDPTGGMEVSCVSWVPGRLPLV